jgi:hypothetical protein
MPDCGFADLEGVANAPSAFGVSVGGVSVRKIASSRRDPAGVGDFTAFFIGCERSSPDRFAKISFGSGSCKEFAFCGRPLKEPLDRTGLPVVALAKTGGREDEFC